MVTKSEEDSAKPTTFLGAATEGNEFLLIFAEDGRSAQVMEQPTSRTPVIYEIRKAVD
jgi:hypothetical protein